MPTNNTKRRLALKALGGSALAGGLADKLPAVWQRPLVHSAALPVHAQSSPLPTNNLTLMVRGNGGEASFNLSYTLEYDATQTYITHVIFSPSMPIIVHESRPGLLDAMFHAAHAQAGVTTPAPRLTGSLRLRHTATLDFSDPVGSRAQAIDLPLSYNNDDCAFPIIVELLRDRSNIYQITTPMSMMDCGGVMIQAPQDEDGGYAEGSGFGVINAPSDRSDIRPQGVAEAMSPVTFRVADLRDGSQGVTQVNWYTFYHPITGQATGLGFGDAAGQEQPETGSRLARLFPAAHAQRGNPQQPDLQVEGSVQYLHFDGFAETSEMDTVGFVLNGQSARVNIQAMREDAPALPGAATTPGISPRQTVSLSLMETADTDGNFPSLVDEALDFGLFPQSGLNDADGNRISPVNRGHVSNWIAENALHTLSFADNAYSGTEGDRVTVRLERQGPGAITFNLVRAGTSGEEDAVLGSVVANLPVTLPPGTQPAPMNPVVGPVTLSALADDYSFDVDLIRDINADEGPETVTLRIEEPMVARGRVRIGEIGQAEITIVDSAIPQPSANRPWVGWSATAFTYHEPAASGDLADSRIYIHFLHSAGSIPVTSLAGTYTGLVYFRIDQGSATPNDDYELAAGTRPAGESANLRTLSADQDFALLLTVIGDDVYEAINETLTLTLVPNPENPNAYTIDPNAASTLITLVNNPIPTTVTPPTPGTTVAPTMPPAVRRAFSWAWGSADEPIEGSGAGDGNTYYATGELVTASTGVIQTEALAESHTYQVFENRGNGFNLLYTVDLVANTVTGENGVMEMQEAGTESGHDFRFNINAENLAFELEPPTNSVKTPAYPVDFTVSPDPDADQSIGLYYNRTEASQGWHLLDITSNFLAGGIPTNPAITQSADLPPPPAVTYTYTGTIDTYTITGRFTLRAGVTETTIDETHLASHTLTAADSSGTQLFEADMVNLRLTVGTAAAVTATAEKNDFQYTLGESSFLETRTDALETDMYPVGMVLTTDGGTTGYGLEFFTSDTEWTIRLGASGTNRFGTSFTGVRVSRVT